MLWRHWPARPHFSADDGSDAALLLGSLMLLWSHCLVSMWCVRSRIMYRCMLQGVLAEQEGGAGEAKDVGKSAAYPGVSYVDMWQAAVEVMT